MNRSRPRVSSERADAKDGSRLLLRDGKLSLSQALSFGLVFVAGIVPVRSSSGLMLLDLAALGYVAIDVVRPSHYGRLYSALKWTLALGCMAIVVSDSVHGVPVHGTLSSLAFPVLLYAQLVFFPVLSRIARLRYSHLLVAYLASHVAYLLIFGASDFGLNPWKYGLAEPITLLALVMLPTHRSKMLAIAVLASSASYSFATGFRSGGGIALVAAVIVTLSGQLGRGYFSSRWIKTAALSALGGTLALFLYGWLAAGGYLGRQAEFKYHEQVASGNLVFAGRPELIPAWTAIRAEPLLGLGSNGNLSLEQQASAFASMAALGADTSRASYERIFGGAALNTHSRTLGAWVQSGVGGALPWLVILFASFRAVVENPGGGSGAQ